MRVAEPGLMYIKSISVRHTRHDFTYHIFLTKLMNDVKPHVILNPSEHQAYTWTTPSSALQLGLVTDEAACLEMCYGVTL